MKRTISFLVIFTFSVLTSTCLAEDWLVWGGKGRNFLATTPPLADAWPAGGPKQLWSRPLGDGYSGIAVEGQVLYTGFHRGRNDVVAALDAKTGKAIWEYEYPNSFVNNYAEVGGGPFAMPQVLGDRIVAASGTGVIVSLDKKTGKVVWSRDLYKEFNGTRMGFGYSCHGLPYRDTVIYMVGGKGNGVIAFRQTDGKVMWKGLDDNNSHSSPILINVDGQMQAVAVFADHIVGFSPVNGTEYWRFSHREPNCACNISTPIWAPGNILFVGTAYGLGARALEIRQANEKSTVKELWYNRRLQLHFGSAILKDGFVYFSVGHDGPALMTAVELKTGVVKYQDRGLSKAQLVYADNKFFMTDQQGMIALARGTPEKFTVLSSFEGLKNISWTAPTIAGTRMYVRDRHILTAYDVGK